MRNPLQADFGIIIDEAQQCSVWPAHQAPPRGWRFTGSRGSRAAMQACVDQQFVPTAPALPPELDSRYLGAQWAAAEFDD